MTITSLGVGSGLDSESIVTQLLAVERAPLQARYDQLKSVISADISAYAKIKSAISGLSDSLSKLLGTGSSLGRTATPAAGAGFTATAGSAAAVGTYQVTVEALATAHKLQSATVASGSQVGYGTLAISVGGGAAVNVDIAQGSGSLQNIRDAINAAGAGVTASVVSGDAGDVLMVTSNKTGVAGKVSISASGGDGGLAALDTSVGTMTVLTSAQDASVVVDGIRKTSGSNTINNMVDGVTLTLTKADAATAFSLDVAAESSTLKTTLLNFVSAYNVAIREIATQTKSGKDVSGPLSGDALSRGLASTLRTAISNSYGELAALGIKTAVDGSMTLDGAAFDAALAANPDAVKSLLGTDGTLGTSLRTTVTNYIGADGLVTLKTNALDKRLDRVDDDIDRLDLRMEKVEARLRKQFAALDTLMSSLNGLSTYITQQMASFSSMTKSK
jgi:flagellar hook-associated protein 2